MGLSTQPRLRSGWGEAAEGAVLAGVRELAKAFFFETLIEGELWGGSKTNGE